MNSAKLQDTKSTYRNHMFLYTKNTLSIKEIKEAIPLTIASSKIKYLGKNLSKEVRDLHTENYKNTDEKKIKADTNNCKDIPCSWIGKLNILKLSIVSKAI